MWNAVLIIAIVSSACVGGVLFAFSSFVMPALGHTPPAEAIRAMQSINVFAQRAPFGIVIPVSAAASIALAARQFSDWQGLGSVLVLVGAGVYLVVGFGFSGAVNIPLNNALRMRCRPPPTRPRSGRPTRSRGRSRITFALPPVWSPRRPSPRRRF